MYAHQSIISTTLGLCILITGCCHAEPHSLSYFKSPATETTIDLVGPPPRVGSRTRDERTVTMHGLEVSFENKRGHGASQTSMRHASIDETETLAVSQGEVTQVGLTHIADTTFREGFTLMGKTVPTSHEQGPLVGRTVIGTRAQHGAQWKFRNPKKRSGADVRQALEDLAMSFQLTDDFYQNVRIGETWHPDPVTTQRYFGDLAIGHGELALKLKRIDVMGGERHAVIEMLTTFEGKYIDRGHTVDMSGSFTGTIYRSLESHTDTRTELQGAVVMAINAGKGTLRMSGPMTLVSAQSQVL